MLIRLALACVLATVLSWGLAAQPASASGCSGTGGTASADGWTVCAGTNPIASSRPEPAGTNSDGGKRPTAGTVPVTQITTPTTCTYSSTDTVDGTPAPAPRAGAGSWVFVYCGDSGQPGGWSWVTGRAPAAVFPSPAQLARQAYAGLTPAIGTPDYNPRNGTGRTDATVVGFATWLWLDGQSLTPESVTATAGPNSATVTARPSAVSFDPGDGTPPVVCSGGGRAYDPAQPNALSDCVHRYLKASGSAPDGVFVLTARVTWAATWTGSNGTGGALPALTVAGSTPVTVDELQAVNE